LLGIDREKHIAFLKLVRYSREQGAGSREREREQGAGSREREREQGAGSREI